MSKIYLKYLYCLFLIGFLSFGLLAQSSYRLTLQSKDRPSVLARYKYPREHSDSLTVERTVREVINLMHSDGYLLAQVAFRSKKDSLNLLYELSIGERFLWLNLSSGNIDKDLLRRAGYKKRQFNAKPFRFGQVARLERLILAYTERNGYPFASIGLDSLRLEKNSISASLNLDVGPLIRFDSLDITSDFMIRARFLGSYLNIIQGNVYDQKSIDNLVRNLRGLPYLIVDESPHLTFQNSEATVHLKLKKRPVNQIDGIIGFLPNANRSDGLLITGQVDIDLLNPFGSGKQIGLHWRRLSQETQNLNIQYAHPALLGSALNFNFNFDFLKQDTLFTKRNFDIGFGYNLGNNQFLNLFSTIEGTDLIGVPRVTNNVPPQVLDFDLVSYGLGFRWNTFDDPFITSRGTGIFLKASTGNKKISRNNALPSQVYEDLDLKTLQYTFELGFQQYLRLKQNVVLVNKLNGGMKVNKDLFRNDAFRLGGLKTIRGFNENFFFATGYALGTLEGRLLFDESSYLLLFTDLAYLDGNFRQNPLSEWALGVGAGMSFSTGSGIFNFVYALGSAPSSGGFNFNQSKIHFGYTTRF